MPPYFPVVASISGPRPNSCPQVSTRRIHVRDARTTLELLAGFLFT